MGHLTFLRKEDTLDFTAMDTFMDHILDVIRNDGTIAVNVFPKTSYVVLSYSDRVAQEVVSIILHSRDIALDLLK